MAGPRQLPPVSEGLSLSGVAIRIRTFDSSWWPGRYLVAAEAPPSGVGDAVGSGSAPNGDSKASPYGCRQ